MNRYEKDIDGMLYTFTGKYPPTTTGFNGPLKIPRNIIQTVPDKTAIGVEMKENMLKIQRMNPNWKYYLFDDEEILSFIKSNYPELLPSYLKINPAYGPARADFFRYLIVFHIGGVYLDSKSGIIKPLDDILLPSDTFVFQLSPHHVHPDDIKYFNGKEINQWVIVSTAGNPIIKNVIDTMIKNINDPGNINETGKLGVLRLTGPIMYTNSIVPLLTQFATRRTTPDSTTLGGFVYDNMTKSDYKTSYSTKAHYSTLKIPVLYP
jgi:mannosyltransferase OCH1-like enzyme